MNISDLPAPADLTAWLAEQEATARRANMKHVVHGDCPICSARTEAAKALLIALRLLREQVAQIRFRVLDREQLCNQIDVLLAQCHRLESQIREQTAKLAAIEKLVKHEAALYRIDHLDPVSLEDVIANIVQVNREYSETCRRREAKLIAAEARLKTLCEPKDDCTAILGRALKRLDTLQEKYEETMVRCRKQAVEIQSFSDSIRAADQRYLALELKSDRQTAEIERLRQALEREIMAAKTCPICGKALTDRAEKIGKQIDEAAGAAKEASDASQ